MPTGLTLCMIVKNEAAVLRRCLASVHPFLERWLVVDTGSTDGTQALVEELMASIPGRLVERPWVNFGANLTEALGLAAESSRSPILRLDADMTVHGQLPSLSCDAGLVRVVDGNLEYRLPLLVRPGLPWRYVGVTHEYLDCSQPFTRGSVDGLVITHHADGGNRNDKFLRDRDLLRDSNLADTRNVFYLAQTQACLGQIEDAIRLYDQRAGMGGWEEEAWYAAYQSGVLRLHCAPETAPAYLMQAWERRPWRAEPLFELAQYYRLRNQNHLAALYAERGRALPFPNQDILFVHAEVYRWGLLLEVSIARARLGLLEAAEELNCQLLEQALPDSVRRCVEGNLAWCKARRAA